MKMFNTDEGNAIITSLWPNTADLQWLVGDRCYHPAHGGDAGTIMEILDTMAIVAWECGVSTGCQLADLQKVPTEC